MTRTELLNALADRIDDVHREHPLRVAIDGVDAAGKTTLANELVAPLEARRRQVIRASVDDFHNPSSVRLQRGSESPEGYYLDSFDYPSLVEGLLQPLGQGGSGRYWRAVFDFRTDSAVEVPAEMAPHDAVLLFDGVFLLRPELRDYWDFSIFVRATFDVTMMRAEERDRDLFGDTEAVRSRYEHRYVPGQRLYLSEAQPERLSDIIVENDDPDCPRLVEVD